MIYKGIWDLHYYLHQYLHIWDRNQRIHASIYTNVDVVMYGPNSMLTSISSTVSKMPSIRIEIKLGGIKEFD